MRSDTRTVVLEASAEHVFGFLCDARNLPRWAIGFAHDVRAVDDAWVVHTSQGEIGLRINSNAELGVIDFDMSPAPGICVTAYSRVIPLGAGAEYSFTQTQPLGMSDAVFDAQVATLVEELKVLQSIVKARGVCPN